MLSTPERTRRHPLFPWDLQTVQEQAGAILRSLQVKLAGLSEQHGACETVVT